MKSDGRFQKVNRLKVNDHIINAQGKIDRVQHVRKMQNALCDMDLHTLEVKESPYQTSLPSCIYVPCVKKDSNGDWCNVAESQKNMEITLPSHVEFSLPPNMPLRFKGEHSTPCFDATYDIGYLLGTFMICGIIVDDSHSKSEYVCDTSSVHLIIESFDNLGMTEKNGLLEVRRGLFSTQVVSHAPFLHEMNKIILENNRVLPREWMCMDRQFLKGIYQAIIQGNVFFFNPHIYHLLTFILFVLPSMPKTRRIKRVFSDASCEKTRDYTLFATDNPRLVTSAICEGIPVTCLSKEQQWLNDHE